MAVPAYDIHLGAKDDLQGYRVRSLVRESAPDFAPRFTASDSRESNLDLLKTKTLFSFRGGMFQRRWEEDDKAARIRGLYNPYDGMLYSDLYWVGLSSPATYLGTGHYPSAKHAAYDATFVAHREGSANTLHKIASDGTVTNITGLPAALSGSTIAVDDLIYHKGYLYVTGQTASTDLLVERYSLSAGTWQQIGGAVVKLMTLRNVLYGINRNSVIFSASNETAAAAASWTELTQAGPANSTVDLPESFVEFNGAGWIGKRSGLYRFDGVTAVRVLPLYAKYLTSFAGALYFLTAGWLYRFDGSTVEKLQFLGDAENLRDMTVVGEYLALLTSPNTATGKYVSSDTDATVDARVYLLDGAAFTIVYEEDTVQDISMLTSVGRRLLLCTTANANFSYGYTNMDFANAYKVSSTVGRKIEVVTSEDDGGYSNIFKSLEEVEVDYADIHASDSIVVSYQYFNGKDWSSWITLGTITSTTDNYIKVVESGSVVKLYKKVKVRAVVSVANGSSISLENVSIRFTLQPRHRLRWTVGLMAYGHDPQNPWYDRNGTAITTDANALRNKIDKAIISKTPVFMLGEDYSKTATLSATAVATQIKIEGQLPLYTNPYDEYPLIAIKNDAAVWEILRVSVVSYNSVDDETTLTFKERGYLGITAGVISAGAEFRLAYSVYVSRLLREAPLLDEDTYNEQTEGDSQIKREFLIQLVEV